MTGFFANILKILQKYWYIFFVTGVSYTLILSILTVFFGSIVGLIIYFARRSKFKPLSWIAIAFVEVIRGTPMLLQLYVGVFLVPKIVGFNVSDFTSVSIALALNSGAYVSEVFRSGIEAVDRGQMEAARTLGLSYGQAMKKVIFPQAIKNILPALGNEFIMIIKDTSLASTFFIGDIMTSYLKVKGNTFLTFECLTIVAVIYFVLTFTLSKLLGVFEKRLKRND
ncbi:MAG: amino acid ABC transporter permease [Lachnospiraceae bacterium]|nr:amino acid ABC transporter permease [Lachnospiraceae bacterium]